MAAAAILETLLLHNCARHVCTSCIYESTEAFMLALDTREMMQTPKNIDIQLNLNCNCVLTLLPRVDVLHSTTFISRNVFTGFSKQYVQATSCRLMVSNIRPSVCKPLRQCLYRLSLSDTLNVNCASSLLKI